MDNILLSYIYYLGDSMNFEKCCGAVLFTRLNNNNIYFLLVQGLKGTYGFPKGHVEQNESEHETAYREIFEELGIKPKFIDGFSSNDEYLLSNDVTKKVKYFLGEYYDQKIILKRDELLSAPVLSYDMSLQILQFDSLKRILTEAHEFLKAHF